MKKKKNKKTFIVLAIVAVLVIAVVLAIVFLGKEKVTLSCKETKIDNELKLINNILIEKKGEKIHLNYTGELEFFVDNEMAKYAMGVFVEKQVTSLKHNQDVIATFEKSDDKITYEFDFNFDALSEKEIKGLLGIYSKDIDELKDHFESGGLICEEI